MGAEEEAEEALTGVVVELAAAAEDEDIEVEVGVVEVEVEVDVEDDPMTAGTTLMPLVLLKWLILPPLEEMLLAVPEVPLYA